jgi:carboxyl-terminal processing protease
MIKNILRTLGLVAIAVILVGGSFGGGYLVSRQLNPPAPPPDGGAPDAAWKAAIPVYWQAWNYVQQDFYKTDLNQEDLVNGSVGGMVDALGDPHTIFIDSKQATISRSSLEGSFEGIGATIEMQAGLLTIVSPIKGTPADKAGLIPGDVILRVNDTIIQNMDVNQAVQLIRGPKGTKVKLLIQRAKQAPFELELIRDKIVTPFVESKMIENTQLAYIRLNQFGATAPDELRAALRTLMAQKPTGLILDLRSDPGGYLSAAVDIASQFIKGNQTVLIEKDKQGIAQELKSQNGGLALDIPMVLLVDKGSASASEILSAALKDYKRATLIGTKTYGKGSVQNVHTLSDNSELNVTIAHFFSPLGNEINDVGVLPHIEVVPTDDDIANKRDPQLDRAVQFLQTGK